MLLRRFIPFGQYAAPLRSAQFTFNASTPWHGTDMEQIESASPWFWHATIISHELVVHWHLQSEAHGHPQRVYMKIGSTILHAVVHGLGEAYSCSERLARIVPAALPSMLLFAGKLTSAQQVVTVTNVAGQSTAGRASYFTFPKSL